MIVSRNELNFKTPRNEHLKSEQSILGKSKKMKKEKFKKGWNYNGFNTIIENS